jgi:hypothetical protein
MLCPGGSETGSKVAYLLQPVSGGAHLLGKITGRKHAGGTRVKRNRSGLRFGGEAVRRRIGGTAFALISLFALRALGAPETPEEIEQCVSDNLPRKSSIQTIVFSSTDRVGAVTESRSKLYWKEFDDGLSKVMMRFIKPLDLRGAGVLMIEKKGRSPDTLMYLPAVRKTRRVSSRAAAGSLFGTDFSYEDFQRLMGMSGDSAKAREPDSEVDGRGVYVIVARPGDDSTSAYERVVTHVDKETCVPLLTESYESGDRLRKQLVADASQITAEGEQWVARKQTITDLRDETKTDLLIEEIELEGEIHRKIFSERELEAGAR